MHLGWLVTTLGLLWEGRVTAWGILIPYFAPLQGQSEHIWLLSMCGMTTTVPEVLAGVVACTDYILVFDCEDSPEEANSDYDPSLIALLLWTCQVNFMLNKEKTYACHSAVYQSGAKNKGCKTQLTRFATWLGYRKWNTNAFVLFTAQMIFSLEEEVATAWSPLPCQMALLFSTGQETLGRMAPQVCWGLLLCTSVPLSQVSLER